MTLLCVQLEEAVVYRLYSENDDLLYIGVTSCLMSRLRTHRHASDWWEEVARVEIDGPLGKSLSWHLEHRQIAWLAPIHNKLSNRRRGWDHGPGGAVIYFPERDEFREPVAA